MERVLPIGKSQPIKKKKKTFFRKREDLFKVVGKVKLWPSRTGTLHGVLSVIEKGAFIDLVTHCGQNIRIKKSRNSRVARWLRNKLYARSCHQCKVPKWKLDKFTLTSFK